MITVDQIKNFAKGTLLQGYTAAATTISFIPNNGLRFPNPVSGAFNVTWWNNTDYDDPADDPQVEIVRIVAGTGDVKTIVRGQEGTAITAKNIPNKTYRMVLSLTAGMLQSIINQIGDGTVQGGANEGGGFPVFDTGASDPTTLVFRTLQAGSNVVIVNNGTTLSISAVGAAGSGYDQIQINGVAITPENIMNFSSDFTGVDGSSKSNIGIDYAVLGANATFGTAIANNATFITALTSNVSFQNNVNNFVNGGNVLNVNAIDDFVSWNKIEVGSDSYGISGNFAEQDEVAVAFNAAITSEQNHPGIITLVNSSGGSPFGDHLTGFGLGSAAMPGTDYLLRFDNDFDIEILARLNYGVSAFQAFFTLINSSGIGNDTVGINIRDTTVDYLVPGGGGASVVPVPASGAWFKIRLLYSAGTLTMTLNGATVYTAVIALTGGLQIDIFPGPSSMTIDVDYVRTNYQVTR